MNKQNAPYIINSISEQHRLLGLPKPKHPMISVFGVEKFKYDELYLLKNFSLNFYCITIKKNFTGKLKYGQRYYDFDEGMLSFISPNQLLSKIQGLFRSIICAQKNADIISCWRSGCNKF